MRPFYICMWGGCFREEIGRGAAALVMTSMWLSFSLPPSTFLSGTPVEAKACDGLVDMLVVLATQ